MSKDKIEVNMNIYDIPIVVEQLEKENKEIERLNNIINELEKGIKENIEELEEHQLSRDRIDEDKEILRFLQELKGSDKE